MGRHKKFQPCTNAELGIPEVKRTRKEINIEISKLRVDIADHEAFIACTRADIEKLMLEYTLADTASDAL